MSRTDKSTGLENPAPGHKVQASRCVRCGAAFDCGTHGPAPCWCTAYPRVLPIPEGDAGCYCPACLAELTAKRETGFAAPPA